MCCRGMHIHHHPHRQHHSRKHFYRSPRHSHRRSPLHPCYRRYRRPHRGSYLQSKPPRAVSRRDLGQRFVSTTLVNLLATGTAPYLSRWVNEEAGVLFGRAIGAGAAWREVAKGVGVQIVREDASGRALGDQDVRTCISRPSSVVELLILSSQRLPNYARLTRSTFRTSHGSRSRWILRLYLASVFASSGSPNV